MNVLSLQIILTEKSLIIEDTEATEKSLLQKRKRGSGECEIVLIFRAKHENEVESQRSEKLAVKQKCQSLFT